MAASKVQRPRARPQLQTGTLIDADPSKVSRHLSELAAGLDAATARIKDRDHTTVTLPVGATRVPHGLGRKAIGCSVTPTTADASWAWAMTAADDKTVTVTTIGVAQANAVVEVW